MHLLEEEKEETQIVRKTSPKELKSVKFDVQNSLMKKDEAYQFNSENLQQ